MDEKTVLQRPSSGKWSVVIFCAGKVTQKELDSTPGRQYSIGRKSRTTDPDISIDSMYVSRDHARIIVSPTGISYLDVGSSNGSSFNGVMLSANMPVAVSEGSVVKIHPASEDDYSRSVVIVFVRSAKTERTWAKLKLSGDVHAITVGRSDKLGIRSKTVSRRHASFLRTELGWLAVDHNSTNGVIFNGLRMTQPMPIDRGDCLLLGGYLFIVGQDELIYQRDGGAAAASASASGANLTVDIAERSVTVKGKKKCLLKDISLTIPSGTMTLILGGSGAGKTTFINSVMGYEPANGHITYDGVDVYEHYDQMKYEIGYVPQQDLLRMTDNVWDTLLNAAKMRLPASLSEQAYIDAANRTTRLLGLEREKDSLVSKLSGGQRKRLSIAVEYIGNPSLFFLDEPDSGLDGVMSRALMENLRTIADQGKIVIAISHAPDRAADLFDRLIVLAKGSFDNCGHLAFYGTPDEAKRFFNAKTLEEVVKRINRPDEGGDGLADEYIRRFAARRG